MKKIANAVDLNQLIEAGNEANNGLISTPPHFSSFFSTLIEKRFRMISDMLPYKCRNKMITMVIAFVHS